MFKKLFATALVACTLCSIASAEGVPIGTTVIPPEPAGESENWLVNETFEDKADKVIGETEGDIYANLSGYVSGGVIDLNGNKVLNVYSPIGAENVRSWQSPVNIKDLESPVTSGYLVYEADLMLPNCGTEEVPVAGGTAYLALNAFTTGQDKCPGEETCLTHSFHSAGDETNNHRGYNAGRVGIFMQADSIGFMYDKSNKMQKMEYSVKADTWYNIKLLVDLDNGTYDIHVNDCLFATDLPFATAKTGIVSAIVGAYNLGTTEITVEQTLGNGTKASSTGQAYGDPRAAYYDNIKLYKITKEEAIAHTKAGFEACFDAAGIRKNVVLPRPGYYTSIGTGVTQHGVKYSAAFETASVFRLNTYANNNDCEANFTPDKSRIGEVTRPEKGASAVAGTVTMHYVKGDVDFSHTVSVTILPEQEPISGYPGVEIGDVLLTETSDGIKASVYAGNSSEADFKATLLLCTYEAGNKLSGLELRPIAIKAGETDTLSFTIIKDTSDDTKAKAFIWLFDGLQPVSKGEIPLQ